MLSLSLPSADVVARQKRSTVGHITAPLIDAALEHLAASRASRIANARAGRYKKKVRHVAIIEVAQDRRWYIIKVRLKG